MKIATVILAVMFVALAAHAQPPAPVPPVCGDDVMKQYRVVLYEVCTDDAGQYHWLPIYEIRDDSMCITADVDSDGTVGGPDFTILQQCYGNETVKSWPVEVEE